MSVKPTPEGNDQPISGPFIVGIGASAGGVEALTQFFEQVPDDSGLAYVVILHLSPDYDSQLSEILQRVASIPVLRVTEKVAVRGDHVYVVSPNKHLQMEDGHLAVMPIKRIEDRRAPVDIFFRTLAESHGAQALAVILSGTGANGSMGLKRIKEQGGGVFVQDPREVLFGDMPRNAIATNLVDDVLPVAQIPARLIAYQQQIATIKIVLEHDAQTEDQRKALREVFTQLRTRTGHDFSNYKRPTLLRRLERRITVRNLPSLATYAIYLRDYPDETQALLKNLLISVTNFFRDSTVFTILEQTVLPMLTQPRDGDNTVRIWIAGCATGEEAYSIAMLCAERTLDVLNAPKVLIFATDLDEEAIAVAREGLYTINDAADVSLERLRRFFTKEGDEYRVRPEIREMVLFTGHNVLKDPPFSRLDMVSCRNLLIYLNRTAQERVLETFHFALNPEGYLLLGMSETVDGTSDLYTALDREHHLYRSRPVSRRSYPVPEITQLVHVNATRSLRPASAGQERPQGLLSYGDLHQRLLEQYAPPSIIVNEDYDILHMSENAGRYLHVAGGEPSTNLLKLIRPEIRLELRTAFYQVAQQQAPVDVRNLKIQVDDRIQTLTIHVRPVLGDTNPARGFILVIFEPTSDQMAEPADAKPSAEPLARQLEDQLIRAKAQMRSSNEQHEQQHEQLMSTNEELQAMNEELRSATEELETSKEELQSVNEELMTVNQELKIKVEEISLTSNNFQNLINSTDMATLFLDRNLRVNLFTPATREIFNLIASDSGRPLSDITNRLEYQFLQADAELVLDTLQSIERDVNTTDGRMFTMRILPYRTAEDRIQGVVITFADVSILKAAQDAKSFMASIVESSEDSVVTIDFEGRITSWNRAAERLYGYPAEKTVGRPLAMLNFPSDLATVLNRTEEIKLSHRVERFETVQLHEDGRAMDLEVVMSPVKSDAGRVIGISIIARDVTQRKQIEAALLLRETDRRKDEFLAMLAHELRNPLAPLRNTLKLLALTDGQDETTRTAVALMNRQVDHLIRLVDDLLDVSRISRGKIELQRKQIDLNGLLTDALDAVRPLYEARHCELSVQIPEQPVYLMADATRLVQVVTNLLTNGVRYTPEGGHVWLTLEQVGNEARLRVRDNGIGLTADQLTRIFDLFVQVDTSLDRAQGGLGLGLTLVQQLVELHGGRVEARSAGLGKGSEFIVHLPVLNEAEETAPPVPDKTEAVARSRRILVVDDNPDAATTLAMLLKLTGYETHVRAGGRDAIEAAERLQPAAVILDIGMPDLDGYQVARLMRERTWGQSLLLIALTGYGQADDKRRSQEAGFDVHLVKPVDIDVLIPTLASRLPKQIAG